MGSLIEARRKILLAKARSKLIDTSPKILADGYLLEIRGLLSEAPNYCVTEKYEYYNPTQQNYILSYYGTYRYMCLFKSDGTYNDYWTISAYSQPNERNILYPNTRTSLLQVTLDKSMIKKSYAYVKNTGQILFAGKDSPYYGYTNINDMPQGN